MFSLLYLILLSLHKEFEFDYHVDYLTKCDDKVISPYLQDLPTIYVREVLGYDPGKSMNNRTVPLEVLAKNELSIRNICQTIQEKKVPDSWKIILVHSKKTNMKLKPRLFAMFVLEVRLYFGITETNISNTIFKYFPQQTMTLSENEVTKRFELRAKSF